MRGALRGFLFAAGALLAAQEAKAQYYYSPYVPYQAPSVELHGGYTVRYGNTVISSRPTEGLFQHYDRSGAWEYYQDNIGNYGARLYNHPAGVTQFDYRNVYSRERVIGVNSYPTNPYGPRWSYRIYGW